MAIISLEDVRGALPSDVGDTVEQTHVDLADLVITTKAGIIFDEEFTIDSLSRVDRYWLRRAVAFESAWLRDHPDLLARLQSHSMSTDGDEISVDDDGMWIAPLARWSLMRTSTFGSRSVQVATPAEQLPAVPADVSEIGWRRWW